MSNLSGNDNAVAELADIAALCDGRVEFRQDGWRRLIYMERLRLMVGTQQHVLDAILCLNHDNATYPTKLYLEKNVGGGLNWNEIVPLLGRMWPTFSWAGVAADQPYIDILAAHLAPLSKAKAA